MHKLYAQGDILFIPVTQVPENLKTMVTEHSRFIIARGEKSGHTHSIDEKQATVWVGEKDSVWIEVNNLIAEVQHQEHDIIKLPQGKYKVIQQRQYVPAANRYR